MSALPRGCSPRRSADSAFAIPESKQENEYRRYWLWGVGMHVAVRAAVLAAAVAGAAIEVWAVRAGWSWVAAALDLLAGWSLLAAAGWAVHLTGGCRGLIGLSGILWFLATPQVAGGTAGHAAALLGGAWLAPLATALLGSPRAAPAGWFQRAVAAACWVRAVPPLAGSAG
jgi:hypothetical protein